MALCLDVLYARAALCLQLAGRFEASHIPSPTLFSLWPVCCVHTKTTKEDYDLFFFKGSSKAFTSIVSFYGFNWDLAVIETSSEESVVKKKKMSEDVCKVLENIEI